MQLELFCQFRDQEYKRIIKYISTRWLSLEAAVGCALRLLPSLSSYFYHKNINHHDLKASWTFRKSHAEGLLIFYQFPLKVFIKLNLLLQREDPSISRVHCHIQRFLKKFINNQKSGNVKKGVLYRLIVRFLYSITLIR